jgi:hypothetical protein
MLISLRFGAAAMLCLAATAWSGPTAAKDKVQPKDIPITKTIDKSSPKLMTTKSTAPRDAATGQASGKRQ